MRDCIESNEALHCLRDLLHESGNPADDPIQVDGIKCVGIPVGTDQFMSSFVHNKVLAVAQDVEKLAIMSDSLVHYHLLKYCQNSRLGYLNRNLPPHVMRNEISNKLGIQHIDIKIADALFDRGTQNRFRNWNSDERQWYT